MAARRKEGIAGLEPALDFAEEGEAGAAECGVAEVGMNCPQRHGGAEDEEAVRKPVNAGLVRLAPMRWTIPSLRMTELRARRSPQRSPRSGCLAAGAWA